MEEYKVNDKVKNNLLVKFVWNTRAYFDITNSVTGWFTGKFVDLMGILYIFEKFGLYLDRVQIAISISIIFIIMVVFGYYYKKSGIYDSQVEATTHKHLYQSVLYRAAMKILNGDKPKK